MTRSYHIAKTQPAALRRCGSAGIFAITLTLLIAATLVVVASAFAAEARRTRVLAADAQLHQILTAGAVVAADRLRAGDATADASTVPLPPGLIGAGAILTINVARDADVATVIVTADLPSRHARQTLRFARRDGRWAPTAATLE